MSEEHPYRSLCVYTDVGFHRIDIKSVVDDIGIAVVKLMQERNITAKYVIIGWETAYLLRLDLDTPNIPMVLFTPVGAVEVIVDPEVAQGVRVLPGINDALRMAGCR